MGWSKKIEAGSAKELLGGGAAPEGLVAGEVRGEIVMHLDRLMVERKISLNELAEKVGITIANLSKIKNNHVTAMRFSTLVRLCEVLDCQVGELMEYRRG